MRAGLAAAAFLLECGAAADARAADCAAYGSLVSVQGEVAIRDPHGGDFRAVTLDTVVCVGDIIRVGKSSRAGIYFADIETVGYFDQDTTAVATARPAEHSAILDLFEGAINFLSREPRSLEIRTPFVNAGVKGTEFEVRVVLDRPLVDRLTGPVSGYTVVNLIEGTLQATSGRNTTEIATNQSVRADGSCPAGLSLTTALDDPQCVIPQGVQPLVVQVRQPNSVEWALYYPQISSGAAGARSKELAAADGLLAVGRVAEALPLICRQPQGGDQLALQAIVELTRNDPLSGPRRSQDACGNPLPQELQTDNRRLALELATKATALSPESAAAQVALSYAWQSVGELEEARKALEKAVALQPDDALARARLAEIWLSLGYRDKALKEAGQARKLAPNLSRTQSVYGFAALAEIDTARARLAFTTAIQLNSADWLARLGLGLAKIRDGDIAAGRREIEIAAGLDPQNSLIRSYLGKAYFEEKRGELAATQFDLAKKTGPEDPTSYLYDAIRLETENRPVEALHDVQKSIALNDNRAVYRSRLQLDEDAAVRSTSLGRIYRDLGFDQVALVEGAKSLSYDPANYSAHRFLSDSYANLPRHEIARSSELLQSQLLQPISSDPVQPQLAETDLNILADIGPADVGFNEFTPLFQHDGVRFSTSAVVGNEATYGDEAVLSGIAGRAAFSLGQFHYQTDGFRPNNDLRHDIYDAFGQLVLTDGLDAQVEFRHRETEQGDLALNFDPTAFSQLDRQDREQDSARVGLHFAPSPASDLVVSAIYSKNDTSIDQFTPIPGGTVSSLLDSETKGFDAQAQYLFRTNLFNLTAGAGAYGIDVDESRTLTFPFPCPLPSCTIANNSPIEQYNAYLYANIAWPQDLVWTAGLSFDSFDEGPVSIDDVNPKVGVQWNITNNLRLRLAYLQTLKRALLVDQTLEPTQVAGFNQFFDDFNGTRSERYGIALDAVLSSDLFAGAEASWRNLKVPASDPFNGELLFQDQEESLFRGYVYWALDEDWTISAEAQFEHVQKDPIPGLFETTEVDTVSVPLSLNYFHPDGWFATLGATFVHQEVDLSPLATFGADSDDFVVVDAAVGYRLANRRGIIALEARNLADQRFFFQDVNIQTPVPSNPRFSPHRTILARLALSF